MEELRHLLAQHGLTLVFWNVLLSQLGLPIPAMPMLVLAGALVAEGSMHVASLAIVVVVASLLGDVPWYLAGKRYGYRVLRTLCRISIEPDSCVKQTENIFTRWGPRSLVVAKYIPGFATMAPPLAGTMRLKFAPFIGYSAAAAVLWAAAPATAGFFFAREVDKLIERISAMGTGALLILTLVIATYIAVKLVERHLLIRFLRMVRISVNDLRQMIDSGAQPVILDVRSPLARDAEPRRIAGAVTVDDHELEAFAGRMAPDRDVVIYCS